ncbi:MAG: ABC transporter permease [Lachnospirales bacterium]
MERLDFFAELFLEHIVISFIAIIIATFLGIALGIYISDKNKIKTVVLNIVSFLYTIPAISFLGLLIPFLGIGNKTAIFTLTIYALLPIVNSTYVGITNIEKSLLEASLGMGCTKRQILYKIKLPLAFPYILAGIRNMAVMTISLTGIASFVGAGGLGVAIYRGITTNNKSITFIGSILIALLAITVDHGLGCFEKRIKGR